jgi:hypothetical protein
MSLTNAAAYFGKVKGLVGQATVLFQLGEKTWKSLINDVFFVTKGLYHNFFTVVINAVLY